MGHVTFLVPVRFFLSVIYTVTTGPMLNNFKGGNNGHGLKNVMFKKHSCTLIALKKRCSTVHVIIFFSW